MTEELLNYMKNLQYEVDVGDSEILSFHEMMLHICDNYIYSDTYTVFENSFYNENKYLTINRIRNNDYTIIILANITNINMITPLNGYIYIDITDYIQQYRRYLNIAKL